MTTEVVIKALHNWPVKITKINPKTDEPYMTEIVPAGETRSFHVYDSQDLRIHEIQPDEKQ